jgi:hypothetical protein
LKLTYRNSLQILTVILFVSTTFNIKGNSTERVRESVKLSNRKDRSYTVFVNQIDGSTSTTNCVKQCMDVSNENCTYCFQFN